MTRALRSVPLLVVLGLLLAGAYVAFVVVSPAVRAHWPLPLIAAAAAAAPFLLRDPVARRDAPLPLQAAAQADAGAGDAGAALRASAVSVAKAGAAEGENEDAWAVDAEAGYVAVADGASSSFRAAEWSRLLCATFLAERPLGAALSTAWIAAAGEAFRERPPDGGDWWNAVAADRGAHAAFAGLAVLRRPDGLAWRATAVGDCVLVHLRGTAAGPPVVTAFPIAHSAAFPANPPLLSSVADGPPPVAHVEGSARIGDSWLLMSDELARWALRRQEAGDPVWELLLGSEVLVTTAIATARATGEVDDDDMTVVRCTAVAAC